VLVVFADACGKFCRVFSAGRRPVEGDARREQGAADDFVPVVAEAWFEEQAGMGGPAILNPGSQFEVVARERNESGEDALAEQGFVFAQVVDGGEGFVLVEADVVGIDAGLELMTSRPASRGK